MGIPNIFSSRGDNTVKSFDAEGTFLSALKELEGNIGNEQKKGALALCITNCGSVDALVGYIAKINRSNLGKDVKEYLIERGNRRIEDNLKLQGIHAQITEGQKQVSEILDIKESPIEKGDCIRLSEYKKVEEHLQNVKTNLEIKIKSCENGTDEMGKLQGLYKILKVYLDLFSKGKEKKGVMIERVDDDTQTYHIVGAGGYRCEIPQELFD